MMGTVAAKLTGMGHAAGSGGGFDADYPLQGETLGLWKLIRGVGRGGMGEVYAAEYNFIHLLTLRYKPEERGVIRRELERLPRSEQSRLASEMLGTPLPADSRFAIKVCSARRGTAGHRRFLQEAELARRLGDHPYIVTVHAINSGDAGDTEERTESRGTTSVASLALETGKYKDVAFMVMDLAACDYDHRRLTIDESVHIVRCIATALDHAHQHGVIHRDLKPENILGTIQHPLLTDFGIAKELDQSLGLTRTGQIIGTLDYMSPEQATDAKSVSHLSDVYSLGVVLYECATNGRLPYVHVAEREACLAAIRSLGTEPKWPRDHMPDFPLSLERIILKAMAKNPRERYQEMSEFIGDLDRFARGDHLLPWGRVAPQRWLRHQRQSHPKSTYAVLTALVLVLVLWAGLAMRPLFDSTGRDLRERLRTLRQDVERIETERGSSHRVQQFSPEQRESLHELLRDVEASSDRYPREYARIAQLHERKLRARYLSALFVGDRDHQASFAKEQLEWAGRVSSPGWNAISDGLQISSSTELSLGPYHGRGIKAMLWLTFGNDLDFHIRLRQQGEAASQVAFVSQASAAERSLSLQVSESSARVLRPLRAQDEIKLWLEIYPGHIEAWYSDPGDRRHSLGGRWEWPAGHGLRLDGAGAVPMAVDLLLPRGAILKQIEVFSELP